MDFLKSAVASAISKGPPFPYSFGDRQDLDQSLWTLHNGTKREDGSKCSIFSFDVTANRSRLPIAKNALRKLRTLRHPGIIKVLDAVESETYIYVATERVTPLTWHVRRKSLSEETAKWGLYTVANTLKFINEEGSSIHGSIRASSIFTSESGEWKIGGLDILSSMKEDDAVIFNYAGLVPDLNRYAPPEVSKNGWDAVRRQPLPALDAYDYGLLIFEVFNAGALFTETTGQTKNVPPSMHQQYKRLLNANPKARLSTAHFLEQGLRSGGFFETPLIRLSKGIESLGLKTDAERADLLSELDEIIEDLPEEYSKQKILPELIKSVEFGGGGPKVFGYVVRMGQSLTEEEYEIRLTPVFVKLFANPDRAIRVCLLDNLPGMIDHFSQKVVSDKIFPQLATGFADVVPLVREQTVKSVLTIINKLPDRTINGELLKHLAKTANDEQPGIRTNTTICLGKIARNLGPHTRQKVLIAAFTRSLRDPFVHARNAALQALAATSDVFTEEDCATKILPALCPVLVDKEKIVRDQASKCFDTFFTRIKRYGNTLPDTALPPASAPTSNGATPRMSTPANEGWTGWAISSFTNKMAGASGEIRAQSPNPTPPGTAGGNRSSSMPASDARLAGRTGSSDLHKQALRSVAAPSIARTQSEQDFGSSQPVDEVDADDFEAAWGEMGDMDDEPTEDVHDDDDDAGASEGVAAAFAAPARPDIKSPPITSPPAAFDDGGEPDFAAWLNAKAASKTKGPLPKGLAKKATAPITKKPIMNTSTAKQASKKPINIKPKDEGNEDDGWGDAWD